MSPGFCESFRLTLLRDAGPFVIPFTPLVAVALDGCLKPGGGRFEPRDGEGEDCEDFAPLIEVCNGGGGRFIFWCGRAGRAEITAAIASNFVSTTVKYPLCRAGAVVKG